MARIGPVIIFFFVLVSIRCHDSQRSLQGLQREIESIFAKQKGRFAMAFLDLSSQDRILIGAHEWFHAASTMKTPVMVEVFRQAATGNFSLGDSLTIKNEFRSIADSSVYTLNPEDDSELTLYQHIGEKESIRRLVYLMITRSSNLATNLLVDWVGAARVMQTLDSLGITEIRVLRGVEDNEAYRRGMNNMVTAYGLMQLYERLAEGRLINDSASGAMVDILLGQEFHEIIPARLPPGVKVAHKTGWFKSVNHDSGIVFLPDGRKYVLVLLSKEVENDQDAIQALAGISKLVYQYMQPAN